MGIFGQTILIARKDLTLELRTKESISSMFFFSSLVIFLFHFALDPNTERIRELAPGLLWLAVIFPGSLTGSQSFRAEMENGCLEGLLLAPIDRSAIFLGKLSSNLIVMLMGELFIFPLFAILFNVDLWSFLPALFLFALMGTLGFSILATLFAGMTAQTRAREVMLPLLLFPLTVPVILATTRGMELVFREEALGFSGPWFRILCGFDLIFFIASLLAFEFVVEL